LSARILVTGVAGFVGSHVAELFLARGDTVVGLDNFDDYYSPAIKRANVKELQAGPGGERFELVVGDVRDRALVGNVLSSHFDTVVHMAGRGGVRASLEDPHHCVDVNTVGTLNVLEAARRQGVGNLLLASTSSAYGNSPHRPFVESDPADRPLAPYAASKRAAEMLAFAYHHNYGLECTVLRFFTVYGPRNRPDMMAYKLLDSLYTGRKVPLYGAGDAVRDWTYVGDVARGVVAAADRTLGYEIVNLGSGRPVRLLDFIQQLEELTGRKASLLPAPRMDSDAVATAADIDKARRLLGYAPGVTLRDGVRRLWEWYLRAVVGQTAREPGVGKRDER
jgi:UDP-glucuronate 4-epimerase